MGNKVTVSARLIQSNGLGYTATEKVLNPKYNCKNPNLGPTQPQHQLQLSLKRQAPCSAIKIDHNKTQYVQNFVVFLECSPKINTC